MIRLIYCLKTGLQYQSRLLLFVRYMIVSRMVEGFDYAYSNYAAYARLKDDGLTVWHPAFLKLERTLDACASVYAAFCKRYQSKAKPNPRSRWGVWQLWGSSARKVIRRAFSTMDLGSERTRLTSLVDRTPLASKRLASSSRSRGSGCQDKLGS